MPEDAAGRALLAALLSSGSFLPDILLSDPRRWEALRADPFLHRSKPRAVAVAEVTAAASGARDFADLARRLRLHRRKEMLRLGAREVGCGTTLEVAQELAALADACLEAAVVFCDRELRAGYGRPISPDGPASFTVLGMGKLGGQELNFSSDVDLVYIYSSDEGAAGALSLHEYYARLSRAVTRAIDEITEEGLVFRVDLRLRPEGRSGAICNSVAAAERYYETFGRTWERQALLRARSSAGDQALGERFLRTLEPFIYPRSVGADLLDEVRTLRRLYQESVTGPAFNVKLGAGGIRDVELVAQVLQLLYAGKRPELRERGTVAALHKLSLVGLLSDHEARTLQDAYRFWRSVEHRLQIEHGAQTHDLPTEDAAFERLARRLGLQGGGDLRAALDRHQAAVIAIAKTLGEPDAGPSSRVLRLLDPASPRERTETDLAAAGFRDPQAAAEALDLARARLPPSWLEEAIASPDPDRALGHFRDLALRGSLGLVVLLRDEPQLLRMLAGLFGTSDRLSRHLLSHPAMWAPLVHGMGEPSPEPSLWRQALPARLAGLDYEEALREMRRFQGEEILRIGLHDVAGNLSAEDVSAQLTALAEVCLAEAVGLVTTQLEPRFGRPDTALTVLALGSFGAREMRYGSDLDLVFLFARSGNTARGVDHQEWFARLAQRLIGALGALLDEGRLYDVDTRLRPSGAQGMLVTSYDAFDRYHQEEAAPWERVALLRARPVFAWPPAAGDPLPDFGPALEEIAYRPLAAEALRAELLRMRARIETERLAGEDESLHLRFSPGGLTDLEFLAAWGQLRLGCDVPAVRSSSPREALARLAERGELAPELLEDHAFLQAASLRLRLLSDRPDDQLSARERPALARSLGLATDTLDAELRRRMARVRKSFLGALT